ncbi:MAG: DUF2007 domain-containing protein [Myxococcaceae bacterium]|nr:DUF2007 domain-containing protein [Myxococcaceae bacterium]
MNPSDTFSVAITTEDPLTADRLVDALQENGIDAFARASGAASADGLQATGPSSWALLVPTSTIEKAVGLVKSELAAIESEAAQNAQAAEEEALSGETQIP